MIGILRQYGNISGLGYVLGDNWDIFERVMRVYSLVFIIIVIFIYLVTKYFNRFKKVIFIIFFSLMLFVKLTEDYIRNELSNFDNIVYNCLSKIASPYLTIIMKFISYLASFWGLTIISAIAYFFLKFYKKKTLYANIIVINFVASTFLNELFKVIFHRERPDILRLVNESGYSFPSGHAMIGLAFYGLLLYLLFGSVSSKMKKFWVTFVFVGLIIAIGISRIYLGVHYASDVLAGFSVGIAWLAVVIAFLKKYEVRKALDNDI